MLTRVNHSGQLAAIALALASIILVAPNSNQSELVKLRSSFDTVLLANKGTIIRDSHGDLAGPGWVLLEISGSDLSPTKRLLGTTIVLAGPNGARYTIVTLPGGDQETLTSWSTTHGHALAFSLTRKGAILYLITLQKRSYRVLPIYTRATNFWLSGAHGTSVLALSHREGGTLTRFNLQGRQEKQYPIHFGLVGNVHGPPLTTPTQHRMFLAAANGFVLVSWDGVLVRQVDSASLGACTLEHWWSAGVALASCASTMGFRRRLWLVPVDRGSPSPLTSALPKGTDGQTTGWQTRNGIYLQDSGTCSRTYLAKVSEDGVTSPVAFPRIHGLVGERLLATDGTQLVLQLQTHCERAGSIALYDPKTGALDVFFNSKKFGEGASVWVIGFSRTLGG